MYLGLNNNHQRRRNHNHRISKDEGFDVQQQLNHPSLLVDPHRGGSPDHQVFFLLKSFHLFVSFI